MKEPNIVNTIVKSTATVSSDGSSNESVLTTKSTFQMTGCCNIELLEEIAAAMVLNIAEKAFQVACLPGTMDNYNHFFSHVAGKMQMDLQMRSNLAACKAEHKAKQKAKSERSKKNEQAE